MKNKRAPVMAIGSGTKEIVRDDDSTISFLSLDEGTTDGFVCIDHDCPATSREVSELRSQVRLLLKALELQKEEQKKLRQTIERLEKERYSWLTFWIPSQDSWVRSTLLTVIPSRVVLSWVFMFVGTTFFRKHDYDLFTCIATVFTYITVRVSFFQLQNSSINQTREEKIQCPVDHFLLLLLSKSKRCGVLVVW